MALFRIKITGDINVPKYRKPCPVIIVENQDFITMLKEKGFKVEILETLNNSNNNKISDLSLIKVTGYINVPRYNVPCPVIISENQDFITMLKEKGFKVEVLISADEDDKALISADNVKKAAELVLNNSNSNSTALKTESTKIQSEINKLKAEKTKLEASGINATKITAKISELEQLKTKIDTKATEKEKAEIEAAKKYKTINYVAGEGLGSIASEKIEVGKQWTVPACTFTAPVNKKFKEWSYTTGGGATKIAQPNDKINIGSEGTITVTAIWVDMVKVVKFNANGGSGAMNNVNAKLGKYTLPVSTFTPPADKQFKQWAESADGKNNPRNAGTEVNFGLEGEITFYAIWEDKPQENTN